MSNARAEETAQDTENQISTSERKTEGDQNESSNASSGETRPTSNHAETPPDKKFKTEEENAEKQNLDASKDGASK